MIIDGLIEYSTYLSTPRRLPSTCKAQTTGKGAVLISGYSRERGYYIRAIEFLDDSVLGIREAGITVTVSAHQKPSGRSTRYRVEIPDSCFVS